MNRRDLFLSTAKGALAAAFGGSWLFKGAQAVAQVVRGTPAPAAVLHSVVAICLARTWAHNSRGGTEV